MDSFWFQRHVEFFFRDFLVSPLMAINDFVVLVREVRKQSVALVGISCYLRKARLSIRRLSSMIAGSDDAKIDYM